MTLRTKDLEEAIDQQIDRLHDDFNKTEDFKHLIMDYFEILKGQIDELNDKMELVDMKLDSEMSMRYGAIRKLPFSTPILKRTTDDSDE